MRILFVDDEPENVSFVTSILQEALDAEVVLAKSVDEGIAALHGPPFALVVTDVFLPILDPGALGRRARLPEGLEHLGGLVLLDEIDRMEPRPKVLVHTACNEHAMVEVLKQHNSYRVPKPAPADVLLRAVLEALDVPTPG